MPGLIGSVGERGLNKLDDVRYVQALLQRHQEWLGGKTPPAATGHTDRPTLAAIWAFQKEGASLIPPFQNGLIKPDSFTLARLELPVIARPKHRYFYGSCWFHDEPKFTSADYAAAATSLGCDPAAIKAVAKVETSTKPAWDKVYGLPLILFERHLFSSETKRRFDKEHPDIAHIAPSVPGTYGGSDRQSRRIWRAAVLNEQAALKSASWGTFQILGLNHVAAGYVTVEAFVDAMMTSQHKHLEAFTAFIKADANLLAAIRRQEWTRFARAYNGKREAEHDCHGRLERAFNQAKGAVH